MSHSLNTLILQSHRFYSPPNWIKQCLASVQNWAADNAYQYHLLDDSLFSPIPNKIKQKFCDNNVILSDIGRLLWIRHFLIEKYARVMWLDSDFLIFDPNRFKLPKTKLGYAVGREIWVQLDSKQRLRTYTQVHNAALLFEQGNSFLDFYIEHSIKMLSEASTNIPPQFMGPKLLTALHNIIGCPIFEEAAMFSPMVLKDIVTGSGKALDLFKKKSKKPPAGANLCASMITNGEVTEKQIERAITTLLDSRNL